MLSARNVGEVVTFLKKEISKTYDPGSEKVSFKRITFIDTTAPPF
jgi:hypothetical protein